MSSFQIVPPFAIQSLKSPDFEWLDFGSRLPTAQIYFKFIHRITQQLLLWGWRWPIAPHFRLCFIGMAAIPFLSKGHLLNRFNLPRLNLAFNLRLAKYAIIMLVFISLFQFLNFDWNSLAFSLIIFLICSFIVIRVGFQSQWDEISQSTFSGTK